MNAHSVAPGPGLIEQDLSYRIVSAFFEVYNWHGFGFLESIYARSLEHALRRRGLEVHREVPIDVFFHEHLVGTYRIDMLVERRIIVEIKASEQLSTVALRQTRNYLAAANLELGILLHFGKQAGFHRVLARRRSSATMENSADAPNSDA